MELEFDKEMDALLRSAAGRGVLVGDGPKAHLDADAIAAFAENAVPQKSRAIYVQHLAECDPCRKTLAHFISLSEDPDPALAASVAPAAATVPWWRTLFAARNLAYTMGALVLVFGGLLGFIVFQDSTSGDVSVSQVDQQPAAAPLQTGSRASESANTVANTNVSAAPAGEPATSVNVDESQIASGDRPAVSGPAPPPPSATGTASNTAFATKDQPADRPGITAAQPAAPKPANERDAEKAEEKELAKLQTARKQDEDVNVARQQQQELQMTPGAGNTRDRMPNRAHVMREDRAMADDTANAKRAASEPSRRVVAGKTFELKQGAWYDTAYSGQRTTNVRRGTDEYRKLDGGLRGIADSLGGTVVVVWKTKAYRIQ